MVPVHDAPSYRLSLLFGAAAGITIAAAALLAIHLTRSTVEDRLLLELDRTAQLVSDGMPLHDQSLRRVADYLEADLVAVDAAGRIAAASLSPSDRQAFETALAAGSLPEPGQDGSRVVEATWAGRTWTVGVATVRPQPRDPFLRARTPARAARVYVLHPTALIAAESKRVWLPVVGLIGLAGLLAYALALLGGRMLRRAQQDSFRRLLLVFGHEVSNPLAAIQGLSDGLRRRAGPHDARRLAMISSEAERLRLLLDGLRATPSRSDDLPRPADALVLGVLELLEHQLSHRRVEVEARLTAPGASTAGGEAIRQVVLNLLLNATEALPQGGRVVVESRLDLDCWVLSVTDDGPGVPPELRGRMFRPFWTTKPNGLGLGLPTCQRLAQAAGGGLTLDPQHTGGARFVLRWPARGDGRQRTQPETAAASRASSC
jgi:signal transduction histidine kinase